MALNVLVVDDSAVMRAMVIKTLRLCGIPIGEVYQAANGQEGLEALKKNWIDLALIDINMPVMNGEEMILKLRENPETADLAVVVVSTESSETRMNLLLNKGAKFVHKPFTPMELKEAITSIVGGIDEDEFGDGSIPDGGYDF